MVDYPSLLKAGMFKREREKERNSETSAKDILIKILEKKMVARLENDLNVLHSHFKFVAVVFKKQL